MSNHNYRTAIFSNVRWRLAIWFVALSTLLYLGIAVLGILFFNAKLTSNLDWQLRVLASGLGHAIEVEGDKPKFRDWLRIVRTEPARSLASIQLFDRRGNLLESYGPKGAPKLMGTQSQVMSNGHSFRNIVTDLKKDDQVIGFLQIQLPTTNNETAINDLLLTMALAAPIMLLGLGASSFLVSGKAVRPIQDNVQMLKEFLADAGHELNTPLAIIRARSEALERRLKKYELPVEDLKVINASALRMEKIVNDLTLLAEMEGPLLSSPKQNIELDKIVANITEQFALRFQEGAVKLEICQLQPVRVLGYPDSLERMISNLLENALKYTDSEGVVQVSVKIEGRQAVITIKDTGIGIPSECLERIFDRFYRVDKSRSRASGGAGLGLSIVQAIAEAHDGKVAVDSELGRGSVFSVIIPCVS